MNRFKIGFSVFALLLLLLIACSKSGADDDGDENESPRAENKVAPDNYYINRANAHEGNYRLYHVVKGRRVQFAGANVKVASGEWHELRVECVGNHITCYYDNEKKIDAIDETFKDAGKVGLWTK